jgi:hypothetical protein
MFREWELSHERCDKPTRGAFHIQNVENRKISSLSPNNVTI